MLRQSQSFKKKQGNKKARVKKRQFKLKLFGFGRKKEEEEAEAREEEPQPEEKPKSRSNEANVERLSAKIEALSELRKADAERFSRISEQIGELRNLILEKEKEITELGVKATKAAELVGELQPENILAEIRKSTTKYDVLEAKIEAANVLYQKVLDELKEVRKRLAMFNGTEELMKLNEGTKNNLTGIQHIEANIESQANKVGNVYVQFQKQANELIRYHDAVAAMQEEFKKLKNAVNEVKLKAQSTLVDQKDLEDVKKELHKRIELAIEKPAEKKLSEQLILETLKEVKQRIERKEQETKNLKSELSGYNEKLYGAILAQRSHNKNERSEADVPSIENETLADFKSKVAELKEAINRGNTHMAIILYNQIRESYVQVSKSSLPDEKKYSLRNQLLEMHSSLSQLAHAH